MKNENAAMRGNARVSFYIFALLSLTSGETPCSRRACELWGGFSCNSQLLRGQAHCLQSGWQKKGSPAKLLGELEGMKI